MKSSVPKPSRTAQSSSEKKTPPEKTSSSSASGSRRELNISLPSLRLIALGLLAFLLLLFITSHLHGGYTVSYDSLGGSEVSAQRYAFQERIRFPAPPTREGYLFTGWYLDENCTQLADTEHPVESDLHLYAGWKPGSLQQ